MSPEFTVSARHLGIASASSVFVLVAAYAVTLVIGFLSLQAPGQPIGDPMFTILEILIILLMPAMVALMAAIYAWSPVNTKAFALVGVVFMSLLAAVTCTVHFAILTLSRQASFAGEPWSSLVFAFKWPSVVYALDILGWDFFFPLAMLFAAPAFGGSRLALSIRVLMIVSGVLSLAGLVGAATGDMNVRNIGVVGYVGGFLVVAALLVAFFWRAAPTRAAAA